MLLLLCKQGLCCPFVVQGLVEDIGMVQSFVVVVAVVVFQKNSFDIYI
jgi:hypothetical protein